MTTKEIAKEYSRTRDIAHKRLARARKAGLERFSSIYSEPMKISDMPKDPIARRETLIFQLNELRKPLIHGYTKMEQLRVHQAKKAQELSKIFDRRVTLDEVNRYMDVLSRMWDTLNAMNLPSDVVADIIEDTGYPPDYDKILKEVVKYAKNMESEAREELTKLRETLDKGKF